MLATQGLHKQHSSQAKETLLLQRACDREAREALEVVGSRREGSGPGTDDRAGEAPPRTGSQCATRVEEVREEYGEF